MQKRYLLVGFLVLLLVVAATAAGCGGTTTTTTAASTPTTAAPSSETTGGASTETTAASSTETTAAAGPATGPPIKVGFLVDFIGPAAAVSKSVAQGVECEVEYVNNHGGIAGRPIEVTTLDCKSEAPAAIANMNKLVKDDKVSFVLGPFSPYEQEPCRQIAAQTETPQMDHGPSSRQQIEANPQNQWGFGLTTTYTTQGKAFEQIVKNNGWKKMVGIADALSFTSETLTMMKEDSAALGYSLTIMPDIVQFGTTDFQPILNKIMEAYKAEKPDAFLLMVNSTMSPQIYKGLRALGMTVPIIANAASAHPSVFAMGPEAVEGMLVLDCGGMANPQALPDSWPLKAAQLAFLERYKAKYNTDADYFAAVGADFVTTMAAAMRQAGGDDKAKVQQALINLKNVVGVQGIANFTPEMTAEGNHGQMIEWVIKDGKFVLVEAFDQLN